MESESYPVDEFLNEQTPDRIRRRYRLLAEKAKTTDFGSLDDEIVVIDTETTGVSYKNDELTQIAAARVCKGQVKEWFNTFVNPGKPIPEEIQHLTNIHDEDVVDAPSPNEALEALARFVGDRDLIAHNADFDRHFCTNHPAGECLKQNTWLDSLDMARIALPRLKGHRLIDLVHAFGTAESTHRADDDVAATCQVYQVLLAAISEMPPSLVHLIASFATRDEWPTVKVFQEFDQMNAAQETSEIASCNLWDLRKNVTELPTGEKKLDALEIAEAEEGADAFAGAAASDTGNAGDANAAAAASEASHVLEFPDDAYIHDAFEPDGIIGSLYDNYEYRDEQVQMSQAVSRAFDKRQVLAVEAGTGVGKSMAYLLPSVVGAKKNGIRVGIATKTNNLLDQLVNKELPALDRAFASEGGVRYTAIKGFSHYPCLLKIQRVLREGPHYNEVSGQQLHQAPALAALLSYIEQSEYDDIDTLKIDYRRLPRWSITTTSRECLRRKCPFYGKTCFTHGVRNKAQSADIIVTNQSMLFCDIAAEGGLLPPVRYWVVDEAHGAEDEGRQAFSLSISSEDLEHIANKVASEKPSQNVFLRIERRFGNVSPQGDTASLATLLADGETAGSEPLSGKVAPGEAVKTLYALCAKCRAAGLRFQQAVGYYCLHVKDLLYYEHQSGSSKGYERIDLWINDEIRNGSVFQQLTEHAKVLTNAAETLITCTQELVAWLDGIEGAAALQREAASMALELKEMVNAAEKIFFSPTGMYVYSATLYKTKSRYSDTIGASLLNIGEKLSETLYANTLSTVFTSATLAVGDDFGSFSDAMGFEELPERRTAFLKLDSSYDYDSNMTIYVPSDMPDPTESSYLSKLQKLLIDVIKAQQGSTLMLFTNRREMESCYRVVNQALLTEDLRVLCQRKGLSVKNLRDEFVKDERVSLMALKSFWEGFDAPGATLKTVVISRLPFKKPSDPLSCERQQNDRNAWAHYVLPSAIIETKQAAGRLIRHKNDTGNLILADHRLLSKGYGKKVLQSMPSTNIKIMTIRQIAYEIEREANS